MIQTRSFDNPSAGRTWNFSGKIKNMTECIAHIKNSSTDERYTCFALKTANESKFSRDNLNKEVRDVSSECKAANRDEEAARFEKLMTGVYMKIYKVIEDKFDCQSMCTTSPFYMTKDVTVGPPKRGCAYAAKEYVDEYASSWGGGMIFFLFYISCVLCWSCSTFSFTGEEANEFVNAKG